MKKELKLLSLFSGIGSPEMGLRDLGIEYNLIGYSEIDNRAIDSYCAIHGTTKDENLGDITKIDIEKLPVDIDLITHGSPCFLKGELVNTNKGFVKIEDIKVGDIVRSHDGTYNKVIETMKNKSNSIYDIKCSATHNINTTNTHPFYILRDGELMWVESKDLKTTDFMTIPKNNKQNELNWEGCSLNYNNTKTISNKLPIKDSRFWYLVGRFIGDGWVTKRKNRNYNISGIKICCGKHELEQLKDKIGDVLHYCVVEDRTTYKLQFCNKELGVFCSKFGIGAKNKKIPQEILDLKNEYLEPLLEGILDSDGCNKDGLYKVTSISKELVYNIGEIVLKTKNIPYMVGKCVRPDKYIIEGRIVNQNDTYDVRFRLNNTNPGIHFVDENYLYSRIRKITNRQELNEVYNIEVENTHSYCVNNISTHNCQDFSVGGKREGGDEGSGTRSSLMWNTVAICEHCKPKYVIWENVKGVLQKAQIHNYKKYLDRMDQLGYVNYAKVINAKDFGLAQDRDRIFVVSIRKDISRQFEFPTGEKTNVTLRQVLDKDVDERFYVKKVLNPRRTKNYIQYDNSGKGHNSQAARLYYLDTQMCTLPRSNGGDKTQVLLDEEKMIGRRITPYEAWMLMGFSREDYLKAEASGQTMGSLYAQAGNSMALPVIKNILKELFLS